MKHFVKRLSALFMAMILVMGVSVIAFAADASVTFRSLAEGFEFQPGSRYTATDLFDHFKNVMPGDKLTESIKIKNTAVDCDFIRLYLRTAVHDEHAEAMQDFLSKLTMRIYNGAELIYESSPDQAAALANNVFLATLHSGESCNLKVELDVPIELDNKYANRIGEVDWIFLAEGIENEKLTVHKVWDDNGYPDRPDSVQVHLLCNGTIHETVELNQDNQWTYTWDGLDDRYQWTVEEEAVSGYESAYKAEGNTVFITNSRDYTPPVNPEPKPEPENLTVKKVWSDEENKNGQRPDCITVTLYNGEQAVDKGILSAGNNWSYTWHNLDGSGDWSVLETGIPKGYTPSYHTKEGVVTITNTASLIQTGQMSWPIPVLGGLGFSFIAVGLFVMSRKRRKNCA
ncbi:Cna B-type domain-containing protein [Hominifimenecus sp. rT4P-3]|uniref:Cna B-type domain-containing protein n=1 Tax=Hominifimenecus sp. rT4P-3 TaxID=3242979 RepID=UPI003DA39266